MQILEQVVNIQKILPEHQLDRLGSEDRLASVYYQKGQIEKAVQIFEHLVKIRASLPEHHPDRLSSQHRLALAYYADGKEEKAVDLIAYVVAIRQKTLQHDHPDRLASEDWLHHWTGK